jgi:hypothetical protein
MFGNIASAKTRAKAKTDKNSRVVNINIFIKIIFNFDSVLSRPLAR